jgi:phage N-6-adenine-methyltransferase
MLETLTVQRTLEQCESVIERGLNTFVEVGSALMEIRDSRLYQTTHATFEDYCRERWGLARSTAYQLIDAFAVVENVRNCGQIPQNESQARPLTSLPPEQQIEAWKLAVETAPEGKITGAHVQSAVDQIAPRPVSYHVSDDSYEWYTPREYIEAARQVMGSIDLDPASSEEAQVVVRADEFYTKEDDGLSHSWYGNVWLNPPYNMPLISDFINHTINDYKSGKIESAIILTNNSTDTAWFHALLEFPVCFTRGRIQFWGAGGEILATRQGQAITYLGKNPNLFTSIFEKFGAVVVRHDHQ